MKIFYGMIEKPLSCTEKCENILHVETKTPMSATPILVKE